MGLLKKSLAVTPKLYKKTTAGTVDPKKFLNGLDVLQGNPAVAKTWGRCGLLCNQASVAKDFAPSWVVLQKILKKNLTTLFGPQQGFFGTLQYNMEESKHEIHPKLQIPIYSLYSETRKPTAEMFANIDTLIIDLQLSGCRIYTFKQTIGACLEAAREQGKKVVVLDRPNPLGGEICEGRTLDENCKSFVGNFAIPMRHGLTTGECARFFNSTIHAELEVITMKSWSAEFFWEDLHRPWVVLTIGLPTYDSVVVYPGTVLFEGTNLSEGRGTTLPFQFIGADYIKDVKTWKNRILQILKNDLPGVFLREAQFKPMFNKHVGKICNGLNIIVTDAKKVRSFDLSVAMIRAAMELYPKHFKWQEPPYEYVYDQLPIELLIGSKLALTKFSAEKFSIKEKFWHEGIKDFQENAADFYVYRRQEV